MKEKLLFACVLFFAHATLSNGVIENAQVLFKPLDIRKFVGTNEPIWTWNTTASESVLCKVDEKKSLTHGSIFFRRKYYSYKILQPIVKDYEGIFSPQQQNVMRLRKSGYKSTMFVAKEALLYWSAKYRCAVIKVTPSLRGHLPFYELRVWNSAVEHSPHEKCIRHFEKLGKRGRVIYDPRCQDILTA
uniref:Lipocalin n=1 Tax=Rhipicephalus appendiculatus TaxID=34631 RepID=A0A131Z1T7_RHIAP